MSINSADITGLPERRDGLCALCDNPARTPRATYCEQCGKERKQVSANASLVRNGYVPIPFRGSLKDLRAAARKQCKTFQAFVLEACREKAERAAIVCPDCNGSIVVSVGERGELMKVRCLLCKCEYLITPADFVNMPR